MSYLPDILRTCLSESLLYNKEEFLCPVWGVFYDWQTTEVIERHTMNAGRTLSCACALMCAWRKGSSCRPSVKEPMSVCTPESLLAKIKAMSCRLVERCISLPYSFLESIDLDIDLPDTPREPVSMQNRVLIPAREFLAVPSEVCSFLLHSKAITMLQWNCLGIFRLLAVVHWSGL